MNWRKRKEIIQQADDEYFEQMRQLKEGLTTPPVEPVEEVKPVESGGVEKKKAGRPKKV